MIVVRGPRLPPVRDAATGRWKSVPEDILWGVYQEGAARGKWPALAGLARQVRVQGYYLDFGVSRRQLGIEVDGLAFHGGQVEWARDHQRQRRIEAAGWRVVRFTAREAAENPVGVLDEIDRMWRR
jgi:very-short-patch-repair endonuclease